ncbi:methyltransferase domain-containing protein [Spiractinospora alimapuensis]|uniref:methyltransferase domain-containing protein n=1 Tax=Spiractinospora alimapuensis TaxID=2820884 RepID=UPI001F26D1AB|nr:methyltransferase domain-containing protein [Spiractinospora alimapuensis]QVQ54441.1 methyltransferase domain-containing protein [Spiractinospora alimapuensis]
MNDVEHDYRRDDGCARSLRVGLVDEMWAAGALSDSRWRAIFEEIPRHTFVPCVFVPTDASGSFRPLDGRVPANRYEWLRLVYSDDIAITQLDGDDEAWRIATRNGTVRAVTMTCTSSQPRLMARMLSELDVDDTSRVLEIGTGTGYNAALLSARLGSDQVSTIDVDPVLVSRAGERLRGLGLSPHIAIGDGAKGIPERAMFDRIVTTAAFPRIPPAWIHQSVEAGVILANHARLLGGVAALVRLVVRGNIAEGRFRTLSAGFMPTRTDDSASALKLFRALTDSEVLAARTEQRSPTIYQAVKDEGFRFFLGLRSNILDIGLSYPDGEPDEQWLLTPDGGWAYITPAGQARQSPHSVLDTVQTLWNEWQGLGAPHRDDFGLTVATDGHHRVWLGNPDSNDSWDLPLPHQALGHPPTAPKWP